MIEEDKTDLVFGFIIAVIVGLAFAIMCLGCSHCDPCVPEIHEIPKPIPLPVAFPESAPLPELEFDTPKLTLEEIQTEPGKLFNALVHDIFVYADAWEKVKQERDAREEMRQKILEERAAVLKQIEEMKHD